MLTNQVTQILELPHEPGTTITVRMLSGEQLKHARQVKVKQSLQTVVDLQGLDVSKIAEAARESNAELEADPLAEYDIGTLVHASVVGWSYDAPVTPENVSALDEETQDYLARAAIPEVKSETDRKNGRARGMPRLTEVTA